jgi:poly-gamma-glutamate synthesis protein (capsule biosynthesis protein)
MPITGFGMMIIGVILLVLFGGVFLYRSGGFDRLLDGQAGRIVMPKISTPTKPEPKVLTASIGFIGDIMMHHPQRAAGYNAETKTYNFDAFFSSMAGEFQSMDRMVGNLETPVAHSLSLGAYPNFNAPVALLTALKGAGFDMLVQANNHTMDKGIAGVTETYQNIIDTGMTPVGVQIQPESWYRPTVETVNGIRVAYIAVAEHLNGYTLPEDKKYMINILDTEKVIGSILSARTDGADVVIVLPHWGVEYMRKENEAQIQMARSWIDAGADAVVGSHPHVVQSVESYINPVTGKKGTIMYSLGNAISNQQDMYTDLGGMTVLRIQKTVDENAVQTGASIEIQHEFMPIYTEKKTEQGKKSYRVILLEEAVSRSADYSKEAQRRIQIYADEYLKVDVAGE